MDEVANVDEEVIKLDTTDIPLRMLYVDGSSSNNRSGDGYCLGNTRSILLNFVICFEFRASNNELEYKALLASLRMDRAVRAKKDTYL